MGFGHRNRGTLGPKRLDGALVQSSVYGAPIALGWGTNRVSVNLIQLEDFKATARKEKVGGKGGGSVTQVTYTYSAAIILALGQCPGGGTVRGISTIWRDKSVFSGSTALSKAGLSLANGAFAQSPWSYMTTNHPTRALGYSRLAYLYASAYPLGDTGGLNNHSAEVQWESYVSGLNDAQPADIITETLESVVPGWPAGKVGDLGDYGDYCLAANLLLSPLIDAPTPAAQFISDVLKATNSECIWSEGLFKVIPYGDAEITGNGVTWTPALAPLYDLTVDDFTADEKPVSLDLVDQSDAYNIVQVEFLNRSNAYNIETVSAQDLANIEQYSRRKQDPLQLHMICDPAVARNVVQLHLQRVLYVRGIYHFELPWDYALLEPMDLVTLTCPAPLSLDRVLVRITQIDDEDAEDGMGRKCQAEPMLVGNASAAIYGSQTGGGYTPNYGVDPGDVESNLFTWSEAFDNADWGKTETTITANATTAPDGNTTAEKIIPTAVNSAHAIYQQQGIVTGRSYVYSFYGKPAGYSKVNMRLGDHTNGANIFVNFSTGVITSTSEFGTGELASSGIEDAGSGWYRAWMVVTVPAATSVYADFYVLDAGGSDVFTGNGTDGVYGWGAMLHPGDALLDYVPTASLAAVPYLFNPPSVLTLTGRETWAAVAGLDPNWGGCQVWVSVDGATYQNIGTIEGRARYGFISNNLPPTADPDTSSALGVDVTASAATLDDATDADADAMATMFMLDTELLSYGTSDLIATSEYALSYLRRGALRTAVGDHLAGDPFVRLDDRIFKFPFLTSVQGTPISVKFQSFNTYYQTLRDLADCAVYTIEPSPVPPPASTASDWAVAGTTFVAGDYSVAALVITGACSNPDATQLQFFFRVQGVTNYSAAGGAVSRNTIRYEITSVTSATFYDTAVSELVGGQWGPLKYIGTAQAGITSGPGGSAPASGTVLLDDGSPGTRDFTVPALVTMIIVDRWAAGGYGGGQTNVGTEKEPEYVDNYGGGGGEWIQDTFSVTPGDVLTYTVGGYGDGTTSFEGLSDAHGGGSGSDVAGGAGGSGGTGDDQEDGSAGGSPGVADGGAPGNAAESGGYGYGGAGGVDGTPAVGRVKIRVA